MKLMKQYNEFNSEWLETTEDEVLEHTEGSGYYLKGTVIDIMKENINQCVVRTPFAFYKAVES